MNPKESAPLHLCLVRMCFPSETVEQMIVLLESVTGTICSKRGCLFCSVSRDVGNGNWVFYTEVWNDRLAFEQHVRSGAFRRVLVAMDQCRTEPEVISGMLSGQAGIASLQELQVFQTDMPDRLIG